MIALSGSGCVVCGAPGQLDHIIPRAQRRQYREDPRNGLPLCGGFHGGHHDQKTAGRLKIDPGWLRWDQLELLAEADWCAWTMSGEPIGEGWRHFEPMPVWVVRQLVNQHGNLPKLARDLRVVVAR